MRHHRTAHLIPQVEEQVRQRWMRFYKRRDRKMTLPASRSTRISPAAGPSAGSKYLRQRLRVHKRVKLDHKTLLDDVDDFEEYLRTDLVPHSTSFDPIEYWLHRRQATPGFAKFALDCLAIPPTSDACERSFSSWRYLIHCKRSRLSSAVIEACTCLRNWKASRHRERSRSRNRIKKAIR